MSISKPFTFTAGTKAIASEVNENFDVAYNKINENETRLDTLTASTEQLLGEKANKNGSVGEIFNVSNPNEGSGGEYNAVNVQTLNKLIMPFIGTISGLVLSINPTNRIGVDKGSCYDSTLKNLMVLTTSTEIAVTGNDTNERKLYLVADSDGTNINLSFTPGSGLYRQIGSAWTNASGNLIRVSSLSGTSTDSIIGNVAPDYANTQALSIPKKAGGVNGELELGKSGWLAKGNAVPYITLKPSNVEDSFSLYDIVGFVCAGDKLINSKAEVNNDYHLIPCKGV